MSLFGKPQRPSWRWPLSNKSQVLLFELDLKNKQHLNRCFPLFLSVRISKWPDFYGCALLYTYEVLHTSKYFFLVYVIIRVLDRLDLGCKRAPGWRRLVSPV